MKNKVSIQLLLILVFSVAMVASAWLWAGAQADLDLLDLRSGDLAQLRALSEDLAVAQAGEPRTPVGEVAQRYLGSGVERSAPTEVAGAGWIVRHHTLRARGIESGQLGEFLRECDQVRPRLLLSQVEISAAPQNKLTVSLVVSELVKN